MTLSTFVESDHPRGQAGNPGQFREKANTAPAGELVPATESELCLRCDTSFEDGHGSDGLCSTCTTAAACVSCGATNADRDADTCSSCRSDDLTDDQKLEREIARRREEAAKWGSTGVEEGSRTPWGTADHVTDVAPGITVAGTPGHGGVKLSPERNKLIPAPLRNSSGWYEEDCEANIPARYFAEEFASQKHIRSTADEMRESSDQSIMAWFPDKWEKANGRELQPGESPEKDRVEWAKRHVGDLIAASASVAKSDPTMVVVSCRTGGADGAGDDEYLVPASEYKTRTSAQEIGQDGRFLIDPKRHAKLPPKSVERKASPKLIRPHIPDAIERAADKSLTTAGRERLAKDLSFRWRVGENVMTLGQIMSEEGVTGKSAMLEHGKRSYGFGRRIADGSSYWLPVSKATFDYFADVPDDRSPARIANEDASIYSDRIQRQLGGGTSAERRKLAEMNERAKQLREQESAARDAAEGTWEEKAAAAEKIQIARERAARVQGAGN